jgi:hypothetical protein
MPSSTPATRFLTWPQSRSGSVRRLGWLWALLAAALLGAARLPAAPAFVYETGFELQSDGDFDGDGRRDLIILDKATGTYRLGYQLSPGVYTWAAARASGVVGATGLGIGKLNSLSYDSLAVTGPDANRVNLIDASNSAAAGLPDSLFIASLGPNLSVLLDIGGGDTHDDLYLASLYNGAGAFRETLLHNDGTTNRTLVADNAISALRERGNPVLLHTNAAPRLALYQRNISGTTDAFSLIDLTAGPAAPFAAITTSRSPGPYDYVYGQFAPANPHTQILLYPRGGTNLLAYQVYEPSLGVYALALSNSFNFPYFFDQVFAVPDTNGTRLLILNTNGSSAVVYQFNGVTAPSALQTLAAPAGEHFTGAGLLGGSGFMAYSAPLGQNLSARFRQWVWNGSAYTNTASGDLPRVSAYSASGNVMQFRREPFVSSNPVLLRLNNAGDWSSSLGFSGVPGNISVRSETFLSSTQGLANPVLTALGSAHPLAAFGLGNQYSNMISLFSFTPPAGDKISDVTISPQPGLYPTTISLQFTTANPGDKVYFRIGAGGAWVNWTNGLLAQIFTNTVVQYYGQPTNGIAKSAVKSAAYTFTQGPATLDSKGDGIPDYVKIALGLPVSGSRDSDGDGYSDLEELIRGTNALSAAAVPTNFPHLDDQAVFDLRVTPRPWDGFSNNVTLCATGAVVHAFDFQGALQGSGSADSNHWPVTLVSNIVIDPDARLVAFATEPHFRIVTTNADDAVGREMVGLVAEPPLQFPPVPYVYGGGNITNEARSWIASASNTLTHLPRAVLTRSLTVDSTLESALFERKLGQLLAARGDTQWSNLTLFPFRVPDASRTNPPQPVLLALESATTNQPGYKLLTAFATISNLVENSASSGIASLRAVTRDIYRIDSLLNNTNPARFALPLDELRYFLAAGTFDSNYLSFASTAPQFGAAASGANAILNAVFSRPTTNVVLVVRADTLGGPCRPLDLLSGGVTFALQGAGGLPFSFPDNFRLLPGSTVQVSGYTDATGSGCAYPAIEVTSILLSSVPLVTDLDGDGNLLIDSWEKRFFGAVGVVDPFGDADGDGYQNLQEMLAGTDPRDGFSTAPGAPAHFEPPTLTLGGSGSLLELHFTWPAAYIGMFHFGVRHTADLTVPFSDLAVGAPVSLGGDEFALTFAAPPGAEHFYFVTVSVP